MTVRSVSLKTVALATVIALSSLSSLGRADTGTAATTILTQAIEYYNALDFETAKDLLLKVDRDKLSVEDRRTFDSYFGWIDTAIDQQVIARQWLAYGEDVLARDDLQEAQLAFEQAAGCEFLEASGRQQAVTRLTAIRKRINAQRDQAARVANAAPSDDATGLVSAQEPAADALAGEVELLAEEVAVSDAQPGDEAPAGRDRPVFRTVVLAEATVDESSGEQLAQPVDEPQADQVTEEITDRAEILTGAGISAMNRGYNAQAASLFRQAIMEDPQSGQAERLLRQMQADAAKQDVQNQAPTDVGVDGISDIADLAQADVLLDEPVTELIARQADDDVADDAVVVVAAADDAGPTDATTDETDPTEGELFGGADEGTRTRAARIRQVRKEQAIVEFENAMKRAGDQLKFANAEGKSETDFTDAEDFVRLAQDVLTRRKVLFTDDEYREKLSRTRAVLDRIAEDMLTWQEETIEKIRIEGDIAEKKRIEREEKQRRETIATLTHRASTLEQETRYEQEVEVLEQILLLDPNNRFALDRLELVQNFVILMQQRDLTRKMYRETARNQIENLGAAIPWHYYIQYPDDWKELSRRRKREDLAYDRSRDSEANRRIYQQLQDRQTFEFDGIALEDVIQYIAEVAGVNIHVKWEMLNAAGVSEDSEVNIRLLEVTIDKALRIILQDVEGVNPLGFFVDDGVITISTQSDLNQNMYTRVYDIHDMILRVPDFPGPRLDLSTGATTGQNIGGGSIFEDDEDEEDEPSRQEIIDNLIEQIEQIVDERSWDDGGSISEFGGQLIVRQTRENHLAILDLLGQLREARAIQISIEARFIQVDSAFLERVGIDLDVFFNIGSNLGSGEAIDIATTTPTTIGAPANYTTVAGARTYQRSTSGFTDPWNGGRINRFPGDHTAQSSHWTPVAARGGSRLDWVANQITTTGFGTSAVPTALSISGAFMDDIEVDFLIEATQGSKTTRVLVAPRLTLFNGQRAYITVGTQRAYVQSWEPIVAQGSAAMRPIIGFVPTGTVLDVEATVSADRRYVTLTVRPQVASVILNAQGEMNSINFGTIGFSSGTSGTVQLPEVEIKDLQTTVSIPDGGTLLLGGQRSLSTQEVEVGVPVLSKVPVINRFFTTTSEGRSETTLLILLKPKIIIQSEEEEAAFP